MNIFEVTLVGAAVSIAAVFVIWWISRVLANFLESLDNPPGTDEGEDWRKDAEYIDDSSAEDADTDRQP